MLKHKMTSCKVTLNGLNYSRYLKRRRLSSWTLDSTNEDNRKFKGKKEKGTSTDDIGVFHLDYDMDENSEKIISPGVNNNEFKTILRMVSNRYDKNSHPPYIVYFTKVHYSRAKRCNNIFRAIKNQHTDYSKTDLYNGVILMEFTNYEVANGVIEHVKELRQLGWIAFIPTLKISRTVIIHNVDPSMPINIVFEALQSSRISKILNIERLKKPVEDKDESRPTNMIKVTFKDPVVPEKLVINNRSCFVKRYIPRTLVCNYCDKYERVNEGCKDFWEKMWKSHCKSNFSVEFECAICEGGKKLYQDPGYLSWLEGVEVDAIKRSLSISKKDAKDIWREIADIEAVIRSEAESIPKPKKEYDLSHTFTEIIRAVEHWDMNYIQDLHLNGMKFTEKLNGLNQTALHLAISNKAPMSLIKLLITVGADVNAEDIFCRSPLYLAITNGDDKFLENFVNVNYSRVERSLSFKISEERRALINLLLESGALVNPVKPKGSVATKELNEDVKSETHETRQLEGYTPITLLHLVAFIGDEQLLEQLLKYGADVNSWHTLFGSPIYMAVHFGHKEIVRILLDHGADVLRPLGSDATIDPNENLEYMSLLHVAINSHRAILVKILLEHMFESTPSHLEGQNIVQSFIKYPTIGSFNMSKEFQKEVKFKELYTTYGPPNTTKTGSPAYKIMKDYSINDYVMCMFLKNGIDINYKNKDGVSALEIAAEKGLDNPYVRLLLRFGADINARNCNGGTALHVALKNKSLPDKDTWDFPGILKYSPDFCIKDNNGRTPLSYVNDHIYQLFIASVKNRRSDILKALHNVHDVANSFKNERQDYHNIKAEIRLLKETPVTWKPYCSLYKFLKLPRDKLKSVLRNEHLVFDYRKINQAKFKYFYPLLREKFHEAEVVIELESRFRKSLNVLLQSDFPDFMGDEIFKYLTLDEVRCVVTASALPI